MNIPERTKKEIERYIMNRIPPGDFLHAVLCNNLKESLYRADEENGWALFDIVKYLYDEAPYSCWGSVEKVKKWLEGENQ